MFAGIGNGNFWLKMAENRRMSPRKPGKCQFLFCLHSVGCHFFFQSAARSTYFLYAHGLLSIQRIRSKTVILRISPSLSSTFLFFGHFSPTNFTKQTRQIHPQMRILSSDYSQIEVVYSRSMVPLDARCLFSTTQLEWN